MRKSVNAEVCKFCVYSYYAQKFQQPSRQKLVFFPRVVHNRPLAVTSQLQLLSAMLEGKVKVWNTEMSTDVKRATRKDLLPDYHSILAIIFNIIHVFFSKTFFVLFLFSLQHGGQIRSSSCLTSRESGLYTKFANTPPAQKLRLCL